MYKTYRKYIILCLLFCFACFLSSCDDEEKQAKHSLGESKVYVPDNWYVDLENKNKEKEEKISPEREIKYRDNVLDIYAPDLYSDKPLEKKVKEEYREKILNKSKEEFVRLMYNNKGNSSVEENFRIEQEKLASQESISYEMKDKNYFRENTPHVVSGYPVDRSFILTQDRFIPVILKTDVISAIPSEVMFQVSKDVYGTDGRYKLLEKGDTVIGYYEELEGYGHTRLNILVKRIIRLADGSHVYDGDEPFGYVTDLMGRTGLTGEIDNKLAERMSLAMGADLWNAGTSYVSSMNKEGDSVSVSIADNAGQSTQRVIEKYLDETMNLKPVMLITGGEIAYIKLNKDIYLREALKKIN